jgi:class 3 adenylate cyclase
VTETPDAAELERLGLYDPAAPDAADRLALVRRLIELGAGVDELVTADRTGQLSDLALDVALRPPGETMTLDRFIESSGLDEEVVRRLWSAAGLPASGPVRVTPDAAEAFRFFAGIAGMLEPEMALAFVRVMGSSQSRLAEALISAFRVDVELPSMASGTGFAKRTDEMMTVVQEVLPQLVEAANAVFKRHMVRVSYELWRPDDERAAVTHERTVGFADIVGSTETVRAASAAALAVAVRQFEERVWELVADAGGRVVKLIGDEAMFVVDEAAAAVEIALRLVEASPQPVRVGLAHGTVVALYGDFYGETVNLAARLVGAADASTVAVSESVREQAGDHFAFDALPARELKGFGDPVVFYRARRR